MRADRLISLLMLLQTRGRMTALELAEQLEVSERTIYRDLDALSIAGIPVYAERGPGGGISLVDGYQTRLTGLTGPEAQALFLFSMAGPLSDLGLGKALDDALLKLSASLPTAYRNDAEHMRQRVHMDATWWYYTREAMPHLPVLQEAVCHDRTLLIDYQDERGTCSQHEIAPYGLVAKASIWFLVGASIDSVNNMDSLDSLNSRDSEDTETKQVFRVSRIQSVEVTEKNFVRPQHFDLAAYWHDYCLEVEASHPQFAQAFRATPEEMQKQPATRSAHRGSNQQQKKAKTNNAPIIRLDIHRQTPPAGQTQQVQQIQQIQQAGQTRQPQQKKAPSPAIISRQAPRTQRPQQKKRPSPLYRHHRHQPQQKKEFILLAAQRGASYQQKKAKMSLSKEKKGYLVGGA